RLGSRLPTSVERAEYWSPSRLLPRSARPWFEQRGVYSRLGARSLHSLAGGHLGVIGELLLQGRVGRRFAASVLADATPGGDRGVRPEQALRRRLPHQLDHPGVLIVELD